MSQFTCAFHSLFTSYLPSFHVGPKADVFRFGRPWDDNGTYEAVLQQRSRITNYYMATLKRITHNSGAYLNEGDPFDPDWWFTFYGHNYNKLLAIKQDYDPDQLLYGSTSVGGERWKEDDQGRLCPVD